MDQINEEETSEEDEEESADDEFGAFVKTIEDLDVNVNEAINNEKPYKAFKPSVDHLARAIEYDSNGKAAKFLAKLGDTLVFEYSASQWRDTTIWEVYATRDNGDVWLWHPIMRHFGATNWLSARDYGINVFFADGKWKNNGNRRMHKVKQKKKK